MSSNYHFPAVDSQHLNTDLDTKINYPPIVFFRYLIFCPWKQEIKERINGNVDHTWNSTPIKRGATSQISSSVQNNTYFKIHFKQIMSHFFFSKPEFNFSSSFD